jgi:hypothetical protein
MFPATWLQTHGTKGQAEKARWVHCNVNPIFVLDAIITATHHIVVV